MGRLATFGMTAGLVFTAAAAGAHAGPRSGFFGPGAAPQSPEVMLYFSHSIGAGGQPRPTFGLRVQQVRQASNSGDPESGDVMHHRELINWQMEAHSNFRPADLRVKLGHRLTYDFTNRRFGSPAVRSTIQLGPTFRNAIAPARLNAVAPARLNAIEPARLNSVATAPVAPGQWSATRRAGAGVPRLRDALQAPARIAARP